MELFNKFLLEFEPGELMYVLKEFDLGLETLADLGCRIEPMYIQCICFDSKALVARESLEGQVWCRQGTP